MKNTLFITSLFLLILNFNAFAQNAFSVTATSKNLNGNTLKIDHVYSKNTPEGVFFVTRKQDPNFDSFTNFNPYGVYYTNNYWHIVDYTGNNIPEDAVFHIIGRTKESQNFIVHQTTESNTSGQSTTIDHPFLIGRENVIIGVTQHYGKYNNSPVQVYFENGQWHIENSNSELQMPIGTQFNLLVTEAGTRKVGSLNLKAENRALSSGYTWDFMETEFNTSETNLKPYFILTKKVDKPSGNETINIIAKSPIVQEVGSTSSSGGNVSIDTKPPKARRKGNGNGNTSSRSKPLMKIGTKEVLSATKLNKKKTISIQTADLANTLKTQLGSSITVRLHHDDSEISVRGESTTFELGKMKVKKAANDWTYKINDIKSNKVTVLTGDKLSDELSDEVLPNRIGIKITFETEKEEIKGYCYGCIVGDADERAPDMQWNSAGIMVMLKPVEIDNKLGVVVEEVRTLGQLDANFNVMDAMLMPRISHFLEKNLMGAVQKSMTTVFSTPKVQNLLTGISQGMLRSKGVSHVAYIGLNNEGSIEVTGR